MITTSTNYQNKIYATSRQTTAKVEFELLDIDAYSDATVTVTGENSFSKKIQLTDLVRDLAGKFATFETNYWKLDGTFVLPPKTTETGHQVGWWSDALSDVNGDFTVNQEVQIDFTQDHSSIGITVTFDTVSNEYAEEFDIEVYNSSAVLIDSVVVTGNTLNKYIWDNNLADFRQIIIIVKKTSSPFRRARITEVDFGIIKEYTDDEIINMKVLHEIDTLSNEVKSDEMKLVLENQNKDFNILNPDGIYPFLQRRQKLKLYIGLVISDTLTEFIQMGVFYLTEWVSDEGTLTVSFTARDILDILEQDDLPETTYTSKTLTYIIEDILTTAGIDDYNIDSALDSITVTGTLPKESYKKSLQTVCLAGESVIYQDRFGTLQIKQLADTSSVDNVDFDNVYNAPKIELNKLINTVNVIYGASTYTLVDPDKPAGEETLAVTIDNPLIVDLTRATSVANWILAELKKRFNYEINWRQNQALEITDIVIVEDDFSEDKTMRITKQEFDYKGYLTGKTKGKGGG